MSRTGARRLRDSCAFTSRDMGEEWSDAFTYAVVLGWDGSLIAFLRDAHQRFTALADDGDPA